MNGKTVNEYDHHVMRDGLKNAESSSVLDMSLYPEVLDSLRKRKIKHQINVFDGLRQIARTLTKMSKTIEFREILKTSKNVNFVFNIFFI